MRMGMRMSDANDELTDDIIAACVRTGLYSTAQLCEVERTAKAFAAACRREEAEARRRRFRAIETKSLA
jgi:hypothetical protein